jgi:hypothetical protein
MASRQWYVKDFINEANHPLATKDLDSLLHSHRRITHEEKAYIIVMVMGISGI